jgi:TRAP-type C4-dicarboxylate transport system permease small subunit
MSSSESRLPSDIKRNHFLNAIDRLNYFLGVFVGGTIYLLLAVIVFIVVAARYIFREPFSWNLDMSVVLLVTGTMLAFGYALQVKAHVSVESFIMLFLQGRRSDGVIIILST